MKTNKSSFTAVLTGLIVIAGTIAVFATGPMSAKTEPVVLPDISQVEPSTPVNPLEKPELSYNPALPEQPPQPEPVSEPEAIQAEPMTNLVPPENESVQPEETQPDPLDSIIEAHRAEWDAIEILPCPKYDDYTAPTTEIPVYSNQEMDALCRYLHEERGIRNGDMSCTTYAGIGQFVCINYTETREEEAFRRELPNGTYPVNSRGESYGSFLYRRYVGQEPDLILADTSNGESGYILNRDFHFYGYPGETTSGSSFLSEEERTAFEQWLETQPSTILIPVYDLERTRIVGYFPHRNENSKDYVRTPEEIQEEKDRVVEQLRRLDWSEEEIAEAIEDLAESHGW